MALVSKLSDLTLAPVRSSYEKVDDIDVIRLKKEPQREKMMLPWSIQVGIGIVIAPLGLVFLCRYLYDSLKKKIEELGIGGDDAKAISSELRQDLLQLGGEPCKFGFDQGSVIEGMFFSQDPNAKTILVCSGSHRSYEFYTPSLVSQFKEMGYNVMVFNYEGFGLSEGSPSEQGVYRSVEAAYEYLIQEKMVDPEQIIGWGYSLGSGAVSHLAAKHHTDVVIDRGFSSMDQVASYLAPKFLKTLAKMLFVLSARFDNISKLMQSKGRILVAQGIYDSTMVESVHGAVIKESLRDKKDTFTYLPVEAEHHHDQSPLWLENAWIKNIVRQFLDQASQV